MCDFVGERFDVVRSAPGVNLFGDHGFFLDVDLRVTSDTCAEIGRKCDSFVKRVGVQRLGMSQSGAHSFDTCTAHVVEGVLLGERPSGSLRVGAQSKRFGVLGVELFYNLSPKHTCGAHLGHFHEVVHTDSPEEGQTGCKSIDIHACVDTGAEILKTVGKGVCLACGSRRWISS